MTEKVLVRKLWDRIFALPKREVVDLVAQLVEHNTFNVGALGSSPSGITQSPPFFRGTF